MIDWLYSKLAVLIASFIILSSMVGLLGAVNGSLRDLQAESIAQRIAEVVDSVASVEGETSATITVATPGERGTVPRTIAREVYFVRIYWDSVWLCREVQPERPWRIVALLHPVYAGDPLDGSFTAKELGDLEAASLSDGLTVRPLGDVQVVRAAVMVEGNLRLLTFVHTL